MCNLLPIIFPFKISPGNTDELTLNCILDAPIGEKRSKNAEPARTRTGNRNDVQQAVGITGYLEHLKYVTIDEEGPLYNNFVEYFFISVLISLIHKFEGFIFP
jgi:hypothetical protein